MNRVLSLNRALSQIISDSRIERIRAEGRKHSRSCWFFGNQVIRIWKIVNKTKGAIIRGEANFPDDLEDAILSICQYHVLQFVADEAGLSWLTIRDYAQVSEYYAPRLQLYYRRLPFSHFVFAKKFVGYSEDILDFDLRVMMLNGGKPKSLRFLEAVFRSVEDVEKVLDQLEACQSLDEILMYDELEDAYQEAKGTSMPPLVFHFLRNLENLKRYVYRAVNAWGLDDDRKERIIDLVDELEKEVKQAKQDESVDTEKEKC